MRQAVGRGAESGKTTRRAFLGQSAIGAAAFSLPEPATAVRRTRRARPKRTVAIFGGGIAGLTAAHELIERGFEVTVYERNAWGGKARSTVVADSARGGRKPLPSELGLQVKFGAFQNLGDTMRRIPFAGQTNGVYGNLVEMPELALQRAVKRTVVVPVGRRAAETYSPQQVLDLVVAALVEMQLPPDAAAHFANRLGVFFSSCDARRLGQWDKVSWAEFIGAGQYGADYYALLARLAEFTQAVKAEECSAKFVAWVFEWFIYSLLGKGADGSPLQVLDGPLNETFIDPWVDHLGRTGVRHRLGRTLTKLDLRDGRIAKASVRTPRGTREIEADWYVCAIPVERARRLLTRRLLRADPGLARMRKLRVAAADGIQFFLREPAPLVDGIFNCTDSPWALPVIPQAQFWSRDIQATYGDGEVRDKFAVIIANWHSPGILYGKTAEECREHEIAHEAWEQIKLHVNEDVGSPVLTDDMLHSWALSDELEVHGDRMLSNDPLVLPTVGYDRDRPETVTRIPNLVLAGDYVQGPWEVANLEAASHSGRAAANAVLEASGARESHVTVTPSYRPPEWEPLRAEDDRRYARGERNVFDLG